MSEPIAELEKAIFTLRLGLKEFEEKYRQCSVDFYAQFCSGQLDDREDYLLWAGLYEMLTQNETWLASLYGEEKHEFTITQYPEN